MINDRTLRQLEEAEEWSDPSASLMENESGTRARGGAAKRSNDERVNSALESIMNIIATPSGPEHRNENNTGVIQRNPAPAGAGNIGLIHNAASNGTVGGGNVQNKTQTGAKRSTIGITHSELMDQSQETSIEQSEAMLTELSGSTNLIGESTQLLAGLMKKFGEQPADPENVKAACMCAREIANMTRLRVDLFREVRKARMGGLF